jgi:leader peptidase (prepilin peptidase)/N-methyltransferase
MVDTDMFAILETYPWIGAIIAAMFGLIFGSFFTFLFYRLKSGEPWAWGRAAARSKCPTCDHILDAPDLIPVLSWVIAQGKCAYCKARISVRYPIIEVVTAIIFVIVYYLATDF